MTLTGKIALVTGGSRGIGRAISIALANAGAQVAVNYHSQKDAADAVVREITAAAGRAIAVRADVADEASVTAMFESVTRQLGDVAILVNNAGVAHQRTIDTVQLADFDEAIRVNLRSAWLVTTAALPAMRRAKWGRIHLPVLGRREHWWDDRPPLRRVQSRHAGHHARLRITAGQGRDYVECDLARPDRV